MTDITTDQSIKPSIAPHLEHEKARSYPTKPLTENGPAALIFFPSLAILSCAWFRLGISHIPPFPATLTRLEAVNTMSGKRTVGYFVSCIPKDCAT